MAVYIALALAVLCAFGWFSTWIKWISLTVHIAWKEYQIPEEEELDVYRRFIYDHIFNYIILGIKSKFKK